MKVRKDVCLFASDLSQQSVGEAKAYIRRFALTKEKVKLVQKDGSTIVVAIKDFVLGPSLTRNTGRLYEK